MKLRYADIQGFMSLDNIPGKPHRLPLGDVTVLLGANGSGKSNVLAFFDMLSCLARANLTNFIAQHGVECLLHYGKRHTAHIDFLLSFDDNYNTIYNAVLQYSDNDGIFFANESIPPHFQSSGKQESRLTVLSKQYMQAMRTPLDVYTFLRNIRVYQFHDTSNFSRIRTRCYIEDVHFLKADGGNLAPFLKMIREHQEWNRYYKRIVRHIRNIMPQFGDFELTPLPSATDYVRLNWRDTSGTDYLFGPHQLSDGSLRFMALATLLLQPPQLLPSLIVLDEPELGLHPAAISELAGMVRMASQHTQVLLATQSTRLVDEFDAGEIVIVERDKARKSTVLRQLPPDSLRDWLSDYSLSELWEKNVLGGQP